MSMSDMYSEDGDFRPAVEMKQLPPVFQGRVKALKNLQLQTVKAESEYYRELRTLDVKYKVKYDEINGKRSKIINGEHEPSGAELEWASDAEEDMEDEEADLAKKVKSLALHPDFPSEARGLPKFWLHTLKNANEEALCGIVELHDEEALAYMKDVTVTLNTDNCGFTLNFHFNENPFFTNQVLTKKYTVRDGPNPESPLEYDGPEVVSCEGCKIHWKGQDLTKRTTEVVALSPSKSPSKPVKSEVEMDSFFDFFSPLEDKEDFCPDFVKVALARDYDIGLSIKDQVIPRAVMYFTGEVFQEEDSEDESEDEESDEEPME